MPEAMTRCSFKVQIILCLNCKVVHLKKLVFQSGVCLLISCNLDHAHCPMLDFKGERELLQWNRPQRQNQFWFLVSKTYFNYLGELVTRLFHFKWRVSTWLGQDLNLSTITRKVLFILLLISFNLSIVFSALNITFN